MENQNQLRTGSQTAPHTRQNQVKDTSECRKASMSTVASESAAGDGSVSLTATERKVDFSALLGTCTWLTPGTKKSQDATHRLA